jgi:signal transduction histidine kinase
VIFEDNGPGVPTEKLDVIFQRFARLGHEETRSEKGVGLGLYIVKELIRAMRGEIKAENAVGGGLRFVIQFQNA